jgi:hypothetical protein
LVSLYLNIGVHFFQPTTPHAAEFIAERLSRRGYLGLHLITGLILGITFIWIMGGIMEDVLHGDPLVAFDHWVAKQALHMRTPPATAFLTACTGLGSMEMILWGGLPVTFNLSFRKMWDDLIAYLTALIGGSLLVIVIKWGVHRARPVFDIFPIKRYGDGVFPALTP